MSTIFVRPRSRGHRLLRTARRKTQGSQASNQASLVVVGVGTAGARRTLAFLQRMSELSEIGRVQSAVFYDCNETTVSYIESFLRKLLGRSKRGTGVQILFPTYIPLPNGFMRKPRLFEEYEGPLERDIDNIVAQIIAQSERCGMAPEAIIEFMGFAGHSVLGGRMHRKLRAAFPATVMLPILMLPHDHASEEWTRRYIWERYEDLLEGSECLLTAQSASHFGEDDVRLATGLAGVEVADFDEEGATGSPLAEACRRLSAASGGWLGMATVKRQIPVMRKFELLRLPPWWRQYAAVGEGDELPNAVGHAIWASLDPPAQLAEGMNDLRQAPQEVVVSLPIHPDALEPLATNAAEVLDRSNLFSQFPNMDIAFNTARFQEGLTREPFLHITRVYPVQGELAPVIDILHPDNPPENRGASVMHETGFGTYYHLEAGSDDGPSVPPEVPDDDDWKQHVRYI